ncbi:hypothetical protein Slin14017_G046890 [Septoria linicola]|nr:hypothetical protein Slin14017_G046890 [Septoria linicola]
MTQSVSTKELNVQLSESDQPRTIKATIRNTSPSTTYTFLRWDTVIDNVNPLAKGTLVLSRTSTGQVVEGPGVMINRAMPPPREDLVELGPGNHVSTDVAMKGPWVLEDGSEYTVKARGSWRAVWPKPASQLTDEELETVGGTDVLQGEFASNEATLVLS